VFINIHTHSRIYDAQVEMLNLEMNARDKPEYYTYGLHPWQIHPDTYISNLEHLRIISQETRCRAIGECGLDKLSEVDFKLQEKVFIRQVRIANEINKPLIIHCVKAFNELINCLNLNNNKVPVIIHGFNNNENIARILVNEGCFFSFGKALLGYDSNASKAIRHVGRKRIFLETDDADISIKYIYRKASGLLGIDEEIVKQQIQANFENLFNIKL
jgi:TatD DNase family protein